MPPTITYRRGDRVKHTTKTDWGLGEVLLDESEDKVQVIFEDAGLKKFMVSQAPMVKVDGEEAKSDYLGLLAKQERKKALAPHKRTQTPDVVPSPAQAIAQFLKHFPQGFEDPGYVNSERKYKTDARDLFEKLLGRDAIVSLSSAKEYQEVCQRSAQVAGKTNLISPYEKLWLRNGTNTPGRQQLFAMALSDVLYGPDPESVRFPKFFKSLYEIEAAKWPIATHFQFLADPERCIFLKPQVTQHAARVFRMDINYTPNLCWPTYENVLALVDKIRRELISQNQSILVPRDMIDLQSFIWVIGAYGA